MRISTPRTAPGCGSCCAPGPSRPDASASRPDRPRLPAPTPGPSTPHALDPTNSLHTWSLVRTMGPFVAPGSPPSGALTDNPSPDRLHQQELPAPLDAQGL